MRIFSDHTLWTTDVYLTTTIWQWCESPGTLILFFVGVYALYACIKHYEKNPFKDFFSESITMFFMGQWWWHFPIHYLQVLMMESDFSLTYGSWILNINLTDITNWSYSLLSPCTINTHVKRTLIIYTTLFNNNNRK